MIFQKQEKNDTTSHERWGCEKMSRMLDKRAQYLLKALVEYYIAQGQPVGSRTLARVAGVDLSSASIRHIMVNLEDMGLVVSPHTSAGRVPTVRGYRLFVDTLLTVTPLEESAVRELENLLRPDSPQRLAQSASLLLSELTCFAGMVQMPRRADVAFRHVEFLRLSGRRVVLILVTVDGDVQNHLLTTERDYSVSELTEAANFLNRHYAGQELMHVIAQLEAELMVLKNNLSELMSAVIHFGQASLVKDEDTVIISGEGNLLRVRDLSGDWVRFSELLGTIERRTDVLKLLNQSRTAEGISLFIGEEAGVVALDECSIITAPYCINGQVVGTLGVIGPTRMAYQKIIPIVDVTARLVSGALSYSES